MGDDGGQTLTNRDQAIPVDRKVRRDKLFKTDFSGLACHGCGRNIEGKGTNYFGYFFCSEACMDGWHTIREKYPEYKVNSADGERLSELIGEIFPNYDGPSSSSSFDDMLELFEAEFPHAGLEIKYHRKPRPAGIFDGRVHIGIVTTGSKWMTFGDDLRHLGRTFCRAMLNARIG